MMLAKGARINSIIGGRLVFLLAFMLPKPSRHGVDKGWKVFATEAMMLLCDCYDAFTWFFL